ncbi:MULTISPECIES: mannonate dehydratase [Rhodobacterales]|jgi:mannonate dehydratase|uniref:Mannonate dehydratase n=4 Tax=Rhodobacterales TaxID=204455 RepID=A0A0U1NPH3_9RHOB|nr:MULTISPECIES: mannonate dehydratase [Rhodobacterales]CRK76596.1 Mannonate dehydratase [Nereida ignava]CUH58853.1 Mannonate dehydratase [Thalassobacter stenotrophicus]CUI94539.1 Mannonate dehydratase [Cognatishimia activa]CUK25231.1 Mannonate dehydratase [Cognatishimia activa]SFJ84323.1 D-mannonate dehydratase [Nereida ignava DSM 16309]
MYETWRWFGPKDQVDLQDIVQSGASGIVTALHHIPPGEVWTADEIGHRKSLIRTSGMALHSPLNWSVVESLPVSENIKRQSEDWRSHVENYKTSLVNLSEAGIDIVCYNFMPILDWTRTDLAYQLPNQATCMRFDLVDFIMFDVFLLKRPGAQEDFDEPLVEKARARFSACDGAYKKRLTNNVISGLPGGADTMTMDQISDHLNLYADIDEDQLVRNQTDFLEIIAPHAEKLGLRLCCHPDDPPIRLLGLPRIMSTEADYQRLISTVDIPANGITFCTGSLGTRADNDLPTMMRRLGDRVHFIHLRNVVREHKQTFGSFHESEHLSGDVDMAAVVSAIVDEETRRKSLGRSDHSIPFRPDHGQDILDDLNRKSQPGYPAIGRLKGLAELRGLIAGLEYKAA